MTARKAKVKNLYLIHHDPDRSDQDLALILRDAQSVFQNTQIATESAVYDFRLFLGFRSGFSLTRNK